MSVDFLDSNVLLYLFDMRADGKRTKAAALVRNGLEARSARISFQVVQETLNTLTGKLRTNVSSAHAEAFLRETLLPLWQGVQSVPVVPTPRLYAQALRLQARWHYSFYDSLIVAAALEARCDRLLTEDLQDGQRIEGLLIENPFKA